MRECAHIAIRAFKKHTHTHTHARKKLAEELAGTELLAGNFVQLCFKIALPNWPKSWLRS